MAECAERIIVDELSGKIDTGIVITKYSHSEGEIPGFEIYEAAHPVPDEAGVYATERALSVREAMLSPSVLLPIDECVGRILSSPDAACPPAVPILIPGERISEEHIDILAYYGKEKLRVVK